MLGFGLGDGSRYLSAQARSFVIAEWVDDGVVVGSAVMFSIEVVCTRMRHDATSPGGVSVDLTRVAWRRF